MPAVASQHNRRLVLTSGTVGSREATVPASPQCLIAAADNVQLPGCADREDDDYSSAGSESCWGEREDIGEDDVVEWGVLPLATRGMESGIEPSSNRFAALVDEEIVPARTRWSQRTVTDCATLLDSDSDAPLLSGTVSGQLLDALEEDLMQPVIPQSESEDRVCGAIQGDDGTEPAHFDLTVAGSLGEEEVPPVDREHTEQDAEQERRQQLSEFDTESVRRIRRRRLVL